MIGAGLVTVEKFYDFTDTRPDEERWELIDGTLLLNEPRAYRHQVILGNLIYTFGLAERQREVPWFSIPGVGIRASDISRPQVDFMVLRQETESHDPQRRDVDDSILLCEIVSPDTADRDLGRKREIYTNLPSLTHYMVVTQDAVDVVVFARDAKFQERHLNSIDKALDLPSLGISLPLSQIYRDSGL